MRRGVVVITAVALLAIGAESASACSCVGPGTVYRSSDHAFTGRLIERDQVNRYNADFTYRILRVYKDTDENPLVEGDEITFRSSRSSASCGISGRLGERKGVMPYMRRGQFEANLCTTTGPENLRRLARRHGDEKPTRTATSAQGASPAPPCSSALATAALAITQAT